MEILLIGIFIGIGLAVLYVFVLVFMAILGIPLETKAGRAKRQAIAEQMRQQGIQDEARRNIEVRAAEDRAGN